MKQLFQMKEVLDSWRRCMEKGILRTATSPAICLDNNARAARMKENVLLPIFEECLGKIRNFISNECLFLFVDCDGVILKKTVELCIN
jgi:transcriptional regulator of acetoin/glycerol metabolism